jgi:chitin disaccharide deacetylase
VRIQVISVHCSRKIWVSTSLIISIIIGSNLVCKPLKIRTNPSRKLHLKTASILYRTISGYLRNTKDLPLANTRLATVKGKRIKEKRNMKMIIRADDVGYTNVTNIGTFEAIDRGVVTSTDIMLDTPGAEDALGRIKEYPWISFGWHTHFWGSPVLDPDRIPSLIEKGTGRFKKNLRVAEDVVFEEALIECRAQIIKCIKISGKAPDTAEYMDSIFGKAIKQVCNEYGIAYDFARRVGREVKVSEKWVDRRITIADPGPAYRDVLTDSIVEFEKYDPVKYYTEDRGHLLDFSEDDIVEQSWHPGYLDYYSYRLGDYGKNARYFTLARIVDVEALCSDRLKSWIKENHIELINFRDALYGTREYQKHLRLIGSDLAVN